jgi:DNA-binding NtrC family response regulator
VNPGLTRDAAELLSHFPWPGNVRELANTLQKALIFNRGCPLDREDVLRAIGQGERTASSRSHGEGSIGEDQTLRDWIRERIRSSSEENLFEQLMDELGALVIREALDYTGGNRTRASKLLGISRPTLIARIEKYGLKIETSVS